MESFINTVNGIVWSPALVYLCLGAGLFLSLRGGFLQLRHLKHMWQLLFQPKDNVTGVSSFQALSMTLAGRVGTGNIAGVATAITFGGSRRHLLDVDGCFPRRFFCFRRIHPRPGL